MKSRLRRTPLTHSLPSLTLNRRSLIQGASAVGLGLPMTRAGQSAFAQETDTPVQGGTLRVTVAGEPPTLDIHQTTAGIVSLITWVMYEPLFTYDEGFQLIPMLAESHEVSEDGLVNTLRLRQGVLFHNGEE